MECTFRTPEVLGMTIKEQIERHPQIAEVWAEAEGLQPTWWASTTHGWCTAGGTHQHHEDSLKQLLEAVTSCTVQCEADCDCGWVPEE